MADTIPPNVRASSGGPPDSGTGMSAKLWGLPRWSWIALAAAAGIVGIMWWRSRSTATTPATSTTGTADPGTAQGLSTEQYESLLAILRDLQGQPSVSATPPAQPGDPNISGGGPIITGGVGTTPPTYNPPASASQHAWVDVAPYTTKNPPWNSTLSGIAAKFGMSVGQLMALNPGITNPNIIHPHQRIYIS